MWRLPRLLAGCALLLSCGPRSADALVLDAATVTLRPARTDGFVLKGRLDGLSLDGADTIRVSIGPFSVDVPLDQVKRKKRTVTFKNETAGARIARLRLDLRTRRFVVVGDDWTLANLPNPVPIVVGTNVAGECRMTRLVDPRARRRKKAAKTMRFVLGPRHGDDGACDVLRSGRAEPGVVIAGVATTVTFRVDATAPIDPGLRVVRLDATGKASGAPVCTPAGNGTRFSCAATVSEASPSDLTFVVQGTAGGIPVSSSGFVVPVVPPRSPADHAVIDQADAAVAAAVDDVLGRLGNTLAARMALLRALAGIPSIAAPSLSPNGVDVLFRYANGWRGGVILNRGLEGSTPVPASAAVPVRDVHAPAPAPSSAPRVIFRTCGDSEGICCQPPDRRLPLLNRDVVIWDTGFFVPSKDDAVTVKQQYDAMPCLQHKPREYFGTAADVESVRQFSTAATLVISSHGLVNVNGRVVLGTGQRVSAAADDLYAIPMDFLFIERMQAPNEYTGQRTWIYTVSQDYIAQLQAGSFPDRAIVYASYCYSDYGPGADPYLDKGAGVFFGYDWKVNDVYTVDVGGQLFVNLVARFLPAGDAFAAVDPKVDPSPLTGEIPGAERHTWLSFTRAARFVMRGEKRIAYVGQPDVMPKASTVPAGESATLTASVEGAGTCELKYHWYGTGEAGDLTGDTGTNDFETTMDTATYTADEDPTTTADDIGVELSSPTSDGIGTACAAADVVPTTTSTSTTTTTTLPTCGAGVVSSAVVTEEIHGGSFTHVTNGADDSKPFTFPQTAIPVTPTTNDAKPWNNVSSGGGAEATSIGNVTWSVAPCSITASGTFDESSIGGSATATAQTTLDTTLQIAFTVSREAPYHLSGFVQASGTAKDGPNTVFYARCSTNGILAEASLQNPTGVPVPFTKDSTAFPDEELLIICGVRRGGASADATGDDMGSVDWSFTYTFE